MPKSQRSEKLLKRMLANARRVATRKVNILEKSDLILPGMPSKKTLHSRFVAKELLERHVPESTVKRLIGGK